MRWLYLHPCSGGGCVVCGACGVCGVWRMVWRMVRGGTRVLILVFSFLLYTWHTNDLDYRL